MPLQIMGQFFGETYRQETGNGLTLSENRYAPLQSTPRHTHEAMLFYLVLRGVCYEDAVQGTTIHSPKTLVYLPAGEPHATRWAPDSTGLCFHLELSESYPASHRVENSLLPAGRATFFSEGPPLTLMGRLYTEFLQWDRFSPIVIEGLILELLGVIARGQARNLPPNGHWLSSVEARLRENLESPPTLTELAEMADIHPSHLVRAFRQRYHVTPGDFIRQLRIEEACRRLRLAPEISLSELALELGFADQSHFVRTFRKRIGVTPGIYRRENRVQGRNARANLPSKQML